ncbi:MAG TPA: OmpH family outer membrane protein [Terriglobales bacterium]|nr:OmpH family outer membrane protein [Terriglobales bacterium]
MTKFASLFAVAVLASVGAFAQAGAPATTAAPADGPAKIGIINIQQAIVATNEGRRDLEALQKKFEPKQAELQNLNKEVTDMQNQLKTQGDKLNEDARNNLVRNIDTKQKNLQRSFEDAQQDFQAQQNEVVNRIGGKLMQVLDTYAKQNGYTVVLDVSTAQSPVLWAAQTTDVTKPVVDAYNAQSGVAAPATSATAPKTGAPARPAAAAPKTPPPATKKP